MLQSSILAFAALASIATAGPQSPGVNCGQSSNCQFINIPNISQFGDSPNNQIPALASMILDGVDDNRLYNNGEKIACMTGKVIFFPGAICAFLQRTTGGVLGRDIKPLVVALQECGACGSISTGFFGGDLDVNHGELTINAVTDTRCNGIC